MGVYYDADITGDGSAVLSAANIYYAVFHTLTVGAGVRELESGSSDHVLRHGWVSFGDSLPVIGGVSRPYWGEVWWLDFEDSIFTPVGSNVAGTAIGLNRSLVRWHLAVGSTGHLYVYGA